MQAHDLHKRNGKVLISTWKRMMQEVRIAVEKVEFMIPSNNDMTVGGHRGFVWCNKATVPVRVFESKLQPLL